MKLSEHLKIKQTRTNANILACIAGGCAIGTMVCASFPSNSFTYTVLACCYLVLGILLDRFDRRQYKKELLAKLMGVQA